MRLPTSQWGAVMALGHLAGRGEEGQQRGEGSVRGRNEQAAPFMRNGQLQLRGALGTWGVCLHRQVAQIGHSAVCTVARWAQQYA